MAMLGAGNSGSNAKQSALDALTAAQTGAGLSVSPYHIPVRTGGASVAQGHRMVGGKGGDFGGANAGAYSGDTNQSPEVDHYDLSDNGVKGAIGAWYSFSDEYRSSIMRKMWYLGLTRSPTDFDGAFSVWNKAVGHAANFATQGREVDPQTVIDMMGDGSQGAGPKTRQSVSRSIDLTDPESAKAWIREAYQQSMGRNPDDAEVRALADALQAQAKAHPRVTTTTSVNQFDDQGNPIGDTTSNSSGGFTSEDAKAFLANRMAADPEANAHQAASTYYPALMQILSAGG